MKINKLILVLTVVLALAFATACTVRNIEPDDTTPPQPQTVPIGSSLYHKTYGAFTLPEHNVQVLTITETEAVLEIKHGDGTLTAAASKQLTTSEYNKYVSLFNENNFMQLNSVYSPQDGDPLVADTGNLEIWIDGQGVMKTVEVVPYSEMYMPPELVNIDEDLLSLKFKLYEKAMEEKSAETGELIIIKFQPMQCEQTPWEKWYADGKIQYLKKPTSEELIQDYYATEFQIQLKDIKEVETDRLVCEACSVCVTQNYFEAQVESDDLETMESDGWTELPN